MILEIKELTLRFGGLVAVNNCTFSVNQNEVFSIIGPNGAGKTTILNLISGLYRPNWGKILLFGNVDLTKCKPHEIATQRIARTFQNINLFSGITVLDNIMIGFNSYMKTGLFSNFFLAPKTKLEEKKFKNLSLEILDDLRLIEFKDELPTNLPFGIQKKIELGRAIAMDPIILLLDEPASGLNDQETQELIEFVRRLKKERDLTILLVEHDMKFVMNLSDRICVLNFGVQIAEGSPEEIQSNPKVIEAYLGEE